MICQPSEKNGEAFVGVGLVIEPLDGPARPPEYHSTPKGHPCCSRRDGEFSLDRLTFSLLQCDSSPRDPCCPIQASLSCGHTVPPSLAARGLRVSWFREGIRLTNLGGGGPNSAEVPPSEEVVELPAQPDMF